MTLLPMPRQPLRHHVTLYLTDRQVAERYGINRATVWAWVKRLGLPRPVKLSAGCARWSVTDLEAWEAERREAS